MTKQPADDDQALSLKLLVVLSKTYKSLMDKAAKDIKNYELTPSEFGILEVLSTKGKIPIQQIGEKILITSGTMTYNLDKLEKKGLVERIPCLEDRRVVYADLTVAGKEMIDRIFPQHAESIQQIMNGLSQAQKQETIELLKLLGKGVHEYDNIIQNY
ncbi:MarR family winged helix-turn-helix transcriptional regulator [Paenibacillus sp. FSL H7-0331]|uniref:MarR family winged helix-turn-helix transcriptional regulator n=1 Tax=Paenibacillus sp. FSL H7-0331 TaxID=1920421 RepID=UPI00096CA3F2|nr:MarR family transcriptional regulator [Paenibacillus sp. FSL H7-0331]OMF12288.1 MarR family transcriptional regulator [Paenibacillus sp. FSL H7-0331]